MTVYGCALIKYVCENLVRYIQNYRILNIVPLMLQIINWEKRIHHTKYNVSEKKMFPFFIATWMSSSKSEYINEQNIKTK